MKTCSQKSSDKEPDHDLLRRGGKRPGHPDVHRRHHRASQGSHDEPPQCAHVGHRDCAPAGFTRDDATCFVLPIFHVSWWPILGMLLVGGKACINRKPNLDMIFKLIQDEKCTHMNMVPTIYGWMVDYPNIDKYDLSSLRLLTYAGSPMPLEILKKCIVKFGNKFTQGYGATETSGAPISMLDVEDHYLEGDRSKYLSSAGKPAICSQLKIVDEDDKTLVPVRSARSASRASTS